MIDLIKTLWATASMLLQDKGIYLLFSLALGAIIFILSKFPLLPDGIKLLMYSGLLFMVTSPRGGIFDQQRLPLPQTPSLHQINLLNLNWLWEMNIAQVRYERTLLFDSFIRGKQSPIPWIQRPAKILESDQRAIGALQFNYTAKIGIDLKDVLVRYDREQRTIYYWIPEPQQTGVVDLAEEWPIRTNLHYAPIGLAINVERFYGF